MKKEDKAAKQKFSVNILGDDLVVSGDISEEYVQKLARYINRMGKEILNTYPRLPRRYLLGLTMINITDEYYKLQNKHQQLKQEYGELKKKLKSLQQDNQELSLLLEEVDD